MPPLPTLVCKECGYVNEGERIYCHGCGAKLDRDAIVSQRQQKVPTLEEKRREVRRIMTPRNRTWRGKARFFFRAAMAAVLVSVIIDAVRPPEGALPLDGKKEISDTLPLDDYLEKMVTSAPPGQRRAVGEKEINAYLKKERFRKIPAWWMNAAPFQRVYVQFEEGTARLTVGATVQGYPLYVGLLGRYENQEGKGLVPVCTGGFIGRLAIAPPLAAYGAKLLPFVLDAVKRETGMLGRLDSIQFAQGTAILTTPRNPAAAQATSNRLLPGQAPSGH